MKKVLFFTLLIVLSCETKSERQKQVDSLENEALSIYSDITSKIENINFERDRIYYGINVDSFFLETRRIFKDSAELGLNHAKKVDSIFKAKSFDLRSEIAELKKVERKKLLSEFESLKKKFHYKKDEFENIGFYTHKRWGNFRINRTTLKAGVNSSGYYWLRSNYYASDWIFHTSITVLIGEKTIKSKKVPTYSDEHITENEGGYIWEIVTYGNSNILREIATNVDKTIKVRFNGNQYHKDITLSQGDKNALKDCYDLSVMIDNITIKFQKVQNYFNVLFSIL
jgi:hypothetical protein